MSTEYIGLPAGVVLCDEHGEIAVCNECDTDLHSPYWSARKSRGLHVNGTGHKVRVLNGGDYLAELQGA